MSIAANCRIVANKNTMGPTTGIKPSTLKTPGDWAKPRVLASCPQSASVPGVASSLVPMKKVSQADNYA